MIRKPSHKMMTWIYLVVFLYIVGGLVLYRYQSRLVLRPDKLPASYQFSFPVPFKEYNVPLTDTDRLNMVWLHADSARGVVLYFHGNTGNIVQAYQHAAPLLENRYDVLLVDYPGFGKSTGPDAEMDLYQDAVVSYQMARTRFHADSIVIYGRSLGTAMASYVAAHEPCRDLILECPFYDYPQLVRRYLPIYPVSRMLRYRFPVYEFVRHTRAPVLIFHGKKDEIIPYRFSYKLKALLKPSDRYVTFPEGHHNDLTKQPGYQAAIDSVLSAPGA